MKVLFVCKGNVGRSQIAEALFRKKFGDIHEVISAGAKLSGPEQPIGELQPGIKEVLDVMNEEDVDVSMAIRNQLTPAMVEGSDKVILIMEEGETDLPDYVLESKKIVKWNLPDVKGKDFEFTKTVKNQIKELIDTLG